VDLELVIIGTELLLGLTADTNGAEIAQALSARGVRVVRRTAVADREEDIRAAVRDALARSGAVLTTGGLGPTRDDITKKVVADLFGAPLQFDDSVWADLLARFARLGRTPAPSNRSQAEVPRGASVLRNRWGTAPGLWLEGKAGLAIMLPGVPGEMRNLLEHEVAPRLASSAARGVIRSLVVRTTGIPESSLAERIGAIEPEIAPLTLAYLPGLEGVDLRLTAWNLPAEDADRRLRAAAITLASRAGDVVYGEGDIDLAAVVLEQARARAMSIATAESCTGGLVGARLTEVPGSSDVFLGGVVAYHNEPVVIAMARGAAEHLGADAAVAVTGIAGPAGGSTPKPVGTVWLGLACRGRMEAKRTVLPGNRGEIRARAAQAALRFLLRGIST